MKPNQQTLHNSRCNMANTNKGIDISKAKYRDGKSRGLGDTVAKVIKVVTLGMVKHCAGCEKRKEDWNQKFPYKEAK